MTAPATNVDLPAVPQVVVQPLTRAAIFLVVTVNPGSASRDAVRSMCGDLAGTGPRGGLSRHRRQSVLRDGDRFGRVGSTVWRSRGRRNCIRSAKSRPALAMRSRRPAICCFTFAPSAWISASNWRRKSWRKLGDAVSPVDEVHGFRYFDDRDLIGFVDGTENPTGQNGQSMPSISARRTRHSPAAAM